MIEHKFKAAHAMEERHGMPYGCFLNKVFDHFGIIGEKQAPKTSKQMFNLNYLIENEYIEG